MDSALGLLSLSALGGLVRAAECWLRALPCSLCCSIEWFELAQMHWWLCYNNTGPCAARWWNWTTGKLWLNSWILAASAGCVARAAAADLLFGMPSASECSDNLRVMQVNKDHKESSTWETSD